MYKQKIIRQGEDRMQVQKSSLSFQSRQLRLSKSEIISPDKIKGISVSVADCGKASAVLRYTSDKSIKKNSSFVFPLRFKERVSKLVEKAKLTSGKPIDLSKFRNASDTNPVRQLLNWIMKFGK